MPRPDLEDCFPAIMPGGDSDVVGEPSESVGSDNLDAINWASLDEDDEFGW